MELEKLATNQTAEVNNMLQFWYALRFLFQNNNYRPFFWKVYYCSNNNIKINNNKDNSNNNDDDDNDNDNGNDDDNNEDMTTFCFSWPN